MEIKMIYATRGNYVLLKTNDTCEPYVVAWWPSFNDEYEAVNDVPKPNWNQGHYFQDILEASIYFGGKEGETEFWTSDLHEV